MRTEECAKNFIRVGGYEVTAMKHNQTPPKTLEEMQDELRPVYTAWRLGVDIDTYTDGVFWCNTTHYADSTSKSIMLRRLFEGTPTDMQEIARTLQALHTTYKIKESA